MVKRTAHNGQVKGSNPFWRNLCCRLSKKIKNFENSSHFGKKQGSKMKFLIRVLIFSIFKG